CSARSIQSPAVRTMPAGLRRRDRTAASPPKAALLSVCRPAACSGAPPACLGKLAKEASPRAALDQPGGASEDPPPVRPAAIRRHGVAPAALSAGDCACRRALPNPASPPPPRSEE